MGNTSSTQALGMLAFLDALKNNPTVRSEFQKNPTAAMQEFALTKEQQQAMIDAGNGKLSTLLNILHDILEDMEALVSW